MTAACVIDKAVAVLRRDVLTAIRYRSGFLITAAGTLVEMLAFYYLSRAIGPEFHPDGVAYFPFLLVGTGIYTFMTLCVHAFLQIVQEAQQTGTFEVLMTTSTQPSIVILLSATSAFLRNSLHLILYLGGGLLLFAGMPTAANLSACVLVFGLSLAIAAAIGMMAAALQIAIQKGSAVVWLLASGVWFLTGTLFPVSALPKPLRLISDLIPITHSLEAMRLALLQGAEYSQIGREITVLALFAFILLPFSVIFLRYTLNRARQLGTLSFY